MPTRSLPLIEDAPHAAAPVIAIKIPLRLVGVLLAVFVLAMLLALSSWSVDDPSLSYATSKPPTNWLGFPGAVIADLGFQVFGLAVFALLGPLAVWSWHLVRRRVPTKMPLRVLAWIGATIMTAGVLAFVMVPASWPLPTGLGGLVGALFETLASRVAAEPPRGVRAALFALVLTTPTVALLWIAFGLRSVDLTAAGKTAVKAGKSAVKARGRQHVLADDEEEPTGNAFFDIALGGLVHVGYAFRTAFRRARATAEARRAAEFGEEPSLDDVDVAPARGPRETAIPEVRPEPRLVARRPINIQTGSDREPEDEVPIDVDDDYDAAPPDPQMASRPAMASPRAVAVAAGPRVVAPAAPPAPG
jgi:S-DNA-T family DNA segregation ATPase FtsK/SpoIIIE